jgi:phytol kinase
VSSNFWISETVQTSIYALVAYLGGLVVQKKNVKVNYTRKINFFALYLVPFALAKFFPYEPSLFATAGRTLFGMLIFLAMLKPLRCRVPAFNTMFASFDRPEDRPNTLLWLSTQIIGGYVVLIPMSTIFAHYGIGDLMFIPVLIHGIGDGLAEPVGIRFGKHKYTTRVFFSTERRYKRSYEGSACVLVTGIIAVVLFHSRFTTTQFIPALLIVPLAMTLAEAWAPHTWDTPYMFLVGTLSLFALKVWI